MTELLSNVLIYLLIDTEGRKSSLQPQTPDEINFSFIVTSSGKVTVLLRLI